MAKKRPARKRHPPRQPTEPPPKQSKATGLKSLSELVVLTGVRAGTIVQAVREGFVAATVRGQYQLGPALLGLIKFLFSREGKLPIYDNTAQCSEMTGIPVVAIKAARKQGKIGQDSSSISLAMLLKVLFEKDSENWVEMRNKFAALAEKDAYELQTGKSFAADVVAHTIKRGLADLFRLMDQRSNVDLPPVLKGMDEAGMQAELVRSDERLKKKLAVEWKPLMRNGEAK